MKKIIFCLVLIYCSCFQFLEVVPLFEPTPRFYLENSTLTKADPSEDILLIDEDVYLPGTSHYLTYYNQNDERWAQKDYGPQNAISIYGCGPTVLSILVSSLTQQSVLPDEMAQWCYENGFFLQNSGSYHSIIPQGASAWGLKAESLTDLSYESFVRELHAGKLIVMLMGKGHFTSSGHFIIIRGVTLDGDLLIMDPNSTENTMSQWDYDLIVSEIKHSYDAGGPVWTIEKAQ
ncbi:MAG: C39 family peptidase [Clostridiales bacterium]|nr:C39 family peptidase [Clostridiales bacterium]